VKNTSFVLNNLAILGLNRTFQMANLKHGRGMLSCLEPMSRIYLEVGGKGRDIPQSIYE
jgi:hypothetical protein